jgi:hypothetical protein
VIWDEDLPPHLPPHHLEGNPFLLFGAIIVGAALAVIAVVQLAVWL